MISTLSLSLRSKRFRGFRSKEQGTRVKDCAKNGASEIAGSFLPSPPPPPPPPHPFHFLALVSFLARQKPVFLCFETKRKPVLRRLSLPWNHCLLLSFFSLLSTLFSISAKPVWLAEEGRGGGEKTNYPPPPFTPPRYPVRRLIAGYVHALCECLKQDMHKRIHGTLIRTVEGYYDDEGLTSHKGQAPY